MSKSSRGKMFQNHSEHSAYLRELVELLGDDKMSLIDFDQLRRCLSENAVVVDAAQAALQENQQWRQDCVARIGGMVKAVAAVNRHPREWQKALTYLESLPVLTADELIEQYRKTAARFRDAFPTSFAPVSNSRHNSAGAMAVSDYK